MQLLHGEKTGAIDLKVGCMTAFTVNAVQIACFMGYEIDAE